MARALYFRARSAMGRLSKTGACVLLQVLSLGFFALFAQGQRQLTEADYHLWSRLEKGTVSHDGKWASYTLDYAEGNDSLFLKNSRTGRMLSFPGGSRGQFAGPYFICLVPGDTLKIADLKAGTTTSVPDVAGYALFDGTIACQTTMPSLNLIDCNGRLRCSVGGVRSFSLAPDGSRLLYFTGAKGAGYLNPSTAGAYTPVGFFTERAGDFSPAAWQKAGQSVAFAAMVEGAPRLVHYDFVQGRLAVLLNGRVAGGNMSIDLGGDITVSDDSRQVFFSLRQPREKGDAAAVQIWNAADKLVYTKQQEFRHGAAGAKIAVWRPQDGYFLQLADSDFPESGIMGDFKHALLWNRYQYEPQYEYIGERDIYLKDITTGTQQKILERQGNYSDALLLSPAGRYLTFFKDEKLYSHAVYGNSDVDLYRAIGYAAKSDSTNDAGREKTTSLFGPVYWVEGDAALYLCDAYDLWKINPDGSNPLRLTRGKELGIVYRIAPVTAQQQTSYSFNAATAGTFRADEEILLEAHTSDFTQSGYYTWSQGEGLKKLVWKNAKVHDIARDGDGYSWVEEDFAHPPALYVQRGRKAVKVYQSNPHYSKYSWGKATSLHYTLPSGQQCNGVLYYPAGYEPGQRYPMVVHLYEQLSSGIHDYVLPGPGPDGVNRTNMTTKGYFVLLPDIVYEIGNTGPSALQCVMAAVNRALQETSIDPTRIGLVGYSFGAYETSYIITQTDRFAAAVAGAAFTDFVSCYLSMAKNYSVPEYFRFETGQNRMGKPFHEDIAGYIRNSPVFFAQNVTTPLLSFAGTADKQIAPTQTIEFHLALRRAGKNTIMLLYPEEGHAFMRKDNIADLATRTEEWLDHYLKGAPPAPWMVPK